MGRGTLVAKKLKSNWMRPTKRVLQLFVALVTFQKVPSLGVILGDIGQAFMKLVLSDGKHYQIYTNLLITG